MLAIIVVVILSFLALFSYKCSHSWTHPAFLTSMLWLIMVLCYNVLQHGLYPLSDLFYCAAFVVYPFLCLFFGVFKIQFTYSKDLVVADAEYEDLSKIVSFVSSIECYSTLFSKYDK